MVRRLRRGGRLRHSSALVGRSLPPPPAAGRALPGGGAAPGARGRVSGVGTAEGGAGPAGDPTPGTVPASASGRGTHEGDPPRMWIQRRGDESTGRGRSRRVKTLSHSRPATSDDSTDELTLTPVTVAYGTGSTSAIIRAFRHGTNL